MLCILFPRPFTNRKYGQGRSQTPCSERGVSSKQANLSEKLFLKLEEGVFDRAAVSSWFLASVKKKANMKCSTLHRGICITWKLKHSWPLRRRWEGKLKCHIYQWNGDLECWSHNLFWSYFWPFQLIIQKPSGQRRIMNSATWLRFEWVFYGAEISVDVFFLHIVCQILFQQSISLKTRQIAQGGDLPLFLF